MNYVFEMLSMLFLYLILYYAIPLMMWKEYLKDKSYIYRFAFVSVVQTFIVIQLVLYLQLLHLCNVYTITISYIVLFYYIRYYKRWYLMKEMMTSFGCDVQKLIFSTMGMKSFLLIYFEKGWLCIKKAFMPLLQMLKRHWVEALLLTLIMGYALWYYSYGVMHFNHYGFGDFTVHHSWIIDMKKGILFSDGIYPMGMHCLVYFLDMFSIFPLRNANLYLGLYQSMVMFLMLYVLVRSLCKSRILPLISVLIMAALHVFDIIPMARIQWTLPQEVGIYSVIATVYFLYRYLHQPMEKKPQKWYAIRQDLGKQALLQPDLILFGMSVALTICIHFYDTILAFFLCVGIAIAYIYKVLAKRYFLPLLVTCIMALIVSCVPFGVGLLEGKGLQASLNWATDVMENKDVDGTTLSATDAISQTEKTDKEKDKKAETAKQITVQKAIQIMYQSITQTIFGHTWGTWYMVAMAICFVHALLALMKRQLLMFSKMISIILQGLLLIFLYDMSLLGLPMLVAQLRVYVFLILHFAMVVSMTADICYELPYVRYRKKAYIGMETCSLAGLLFFTYAIYDQGWDDKKLYQEFTIYNDAIDCTNQINHQFPDNQWTVISTISELTTTKEHGYHYELWEFLRDIEKGKSQYIPTQHVFIYVEKKPMDYANYVYYNDMKINQFKLSEKEAKRKLNLENQTDDIYKGSDRVSIFSKTYVWCQMMLKMYPNDFTIYYDSDDFVCYQLTQNPFHLIDLSIPLDDTDRKVWSAYD